MRVTSESNSGPPSRTPSIMDSPTLVRVERARLRQEADSNGQRPGSGQREDSLERCLLDPKKSLLIGRIPVAQMTGPIKRGLLWQQRDRLFSRWKERYFILTRDYLNCFKRATGSASEKISDMGQFIFKIKLVDVEKVEWLNRRSYSAIGLLLGSREGRVLLRSDQGLEDWFELLEECTLSSKERRRALRLTQGPRSRASLAAPVSAASLQNNHLGLGGTYSGAIEDWLMSRHQKPGGQRFNHILLSDSVPDLSSINENGLCSGLLTNHSTPKKVPNARHNLSGGGGSSNGYSSHNGSLYNGFPYSPLKKLADNFVNGNHSYTLHDDLEEEVELRRGGRYRENDDLYRRPLGPGGNDSSRHSFLTDLDYTGCDSGLDTPPSTHRPSSCRDNIYFGSAYNNHGHGSGFLGKDKTTDTGISSSRGTLVSPASSIRHGYVNVQNFNGNNTTNNNNHLNSYGSRYSVQEQKILRARNTEENKNSIRSVRAEFFEQSKYNSNGSNSAIANNNNNINNNGSGHHAAHYHPHHHQHVAQHPNGVGSNGNIHQHFNGLNNNIHSTSSNSSSSNNNNHSNNNNGNGGGGGGIGTLNDRAAPFLSANGNGTGSQRDRYQQHPALAAIINESQGMKFRDRSYSDCQQAAPRARQWTSNTPSPKRIPFLGTPPTRV
ncbi:probable serine/threonine-protein kinase clkA isoform X1 [Anopheles funestus]|uniref:probable serine/threonine-protein kinase clkA isoform X1 n=2 Tax=Anopheles funestus TaxID=62324 RepID=UPI0020C5B985|nr:probable serine/threonine-protein kinase clkA isoform X1 [Anopheles funestus]XP_049280673.1 probable serine/threonine-protein kinase clkA isoform X1 [Anopheles funestus]